eukprot:1144495-Pelagomonas_calceolata.AAC.2
MASIASMMPRNSYCSNAVSKALPNSIKFNFMPNAFTLNAFSNKTLGDAQDSTAKTEALMYSAPYLQRRSCHRSD